MTDYAHIMAEVSIRDWVEKRGVREVWIWGYQGGRRLMILTEQRARAHPAAIIRPPLRRPGPAGTRGERGAG